MQSVMEVIGTKMDVLTETDRENKCDEDAFLWFCALYTED